MSRCQGCEKNQIKLIQNWIQPLWKKSNYFEEKIEPNHFIYENSSINQIISKTRFGLVQVFRRINSHMDTKGSLLKHERERDWESNSDREG